VANAVDARNQGDDYQARVFWYYALRMLDDKGSISGVRYETEEPKSFDDVIIDYSPAISSSTGPHQIECDCYQVKWQVTRAQPFGYEDLVDPKFINATSFSLLQKLKLAKQKALACTRFNFLTTAKIADTDPLRRLFSGNDNSLRLDQLFDGTTTERAAMFKVRKLWREHLELDTDDELRALLSDFHIHDNKWSLEDIKEQIRLLCRVVGLHPGELSDTDFRYDNLVKGWKRRGLNKFSQTELVDLLNQEGLRVDQPVPDKFLNIAVRTFSFDNDGGWIAKAQDTLDLTRLFRMRYLEDDVSWQTDIQTEVTKFLDAVPNKTKQIRLHLDAHASIALLSGTVLHSKKGCEIELIQKGRLGSKIWRVDDGSEGQVPTLKIQKTGTGSDIALAIGITHSVQQQAIDYINANLPEVGNVLIFEPVGGPSSTAITGGTHAVQIADAIVSATRTNELYSPDSTIHIFAACPNSILFFLGQCYNALGSCVVYEYDFDRKGDRSYQPSFQIN
jgi:hypothetical protein